MIALLEWPGGSWEATATGVAAIFIIYLAVLWLAVVYWTARDIHQRSGSGVVEIGAVLLVAVLFVPGLWLYLVLRPRKTRAQRYAIVLEEQALELELDRAEACPGCRRVVRDEFLICPACKTQLKKPCPSCSHPLSEGWAACPYCAADMAAEPPEIIAGRRAPVLAPVATRPIQAQANPTQ